MDIWYNLAKSILRAYVTLFFDSIHVLGKSDLPEGPKVIVANHTNLTDGFVLPFVIKERLHYLIQADAFTLPVIGRLLALADQIPVNIGRGLEALEAAKVRLSWGHSVVIFPEGRLNDGRSLHRAGVGAARLAAESGATIVPVGFFVPDQYARWIKGHFHGREALARWQFGGKCFVKIGDSWDIKAILQENMNYRELRRLTEKLMARIAELVHQAQDEARRMGF